MSEHRLPQPDVCSTAESRTRLDSPVSHDLPRLDSPVSPSRDGVPQSAQPRRVKLTVVGDGTVGKTCLLYAFINRRAPSDEYMPTVFENTSVDTTMAGRAVQLSLWDTAGQEEYCRLRRLIYPASDIFVLCYAVNNSSSYENISTKWWPELRSFCPTTPIVLVATKTDLRPGGPASGPGPGSGSASGPVPGSGSASGPVPGSGPGPGPVSETELPPEPVITTRQGRRLARRLRAAGFLECSARAFCGVQEVFETSVKAVLAADRRRHRWQRARRCCRVQ